MRVSPARTAYARIAAVAVLTASIAPSSCKSPPPPCDLDTLLQARAGAAAVNCGHVAVGASSTATDQCIADQSAAGTPFYARYDGQGIDSRVAVGVVRDPSGRTSVLHWDSNPSGGPTAAPQITESVCGGNPPVQTQLTGPGGFDFAACNVVTSTVLACG